jgi:hypothetical protein
VRFASAVAAIAKIRKPSGWRKANQSVNQPEPWVTPLASTQIPCCWTIELRLIVPARMISPTTDRVNGIS